MKEGGRGLLSSSSSSSLTHHHSQPEDSGRRVARCSGETKEPNLILTRKPGRAIPGPCRHNSTRDSPKPSTVAEMLRSLRPPGTLKPPTPPEVPSTLTLLPSTLQSPEPPRATSMPQSSQFPFRSRSSLQRHGGRCGVWLRTGRADGMLRREQPLRLLRVISSRLFSSILPVRSGEELVLESLGTRGERGTRLR